MCTVCASTICGGTGGCQAAAQTAKVVLQNPQPIQVTITYAQSSFSWLYSAIATTFTGLQEAGRASVRSLFIK